MGVATMGFPRIGQTRNYDLHEFRLAKRKQRTVKICAQSFQNSRVEDASVVNTSLIYHDDRAQKNGLAARHRPI